MSNWLLFALLAVLVAVDAYFTYRKSTDYDETGRRLLAAAQLIYLVFIGVIFLLGKILGSAGIATTLKGTGGFIAMLVIVAVVLGVMIFCKKKIEKKIKDEHKL